MPVFTTTQEQMVGQDMIGGRLLLVSSERGLDFGGSLVHMGNVQVPEGQPARARQRQPLQPARAVPEGPARRARASSSRRTSESSEGVESWYAEASYRFLKKWQVAAQYEHSKILVPEGDTSIPDTLDAQRVYRPRAQLLGEPRVRAEAERLRRRRQHGGQAGERRPRRGARDHRREDRACCVVGAQFSF